MNGGVRKEDRALMDDVQIAPVVGFTEPRVIHFQPVRTRGFEVEAHAPLIPISQLTLEEPVSGGIEQTPFPRVAGLEVVHVC